MRPEQMRRHADYEAASGNKLIAACLRDAARDVCPHGLVRAYCDEHRRPVPVKRRSALSCVVRGCGTMPHVGVHPGTGLVVMLILTGAAAGWKGGLVGCLIGAGIMAAGMVPIYLVGAYSRARLSDRLANAPTTPGMREEEG